MINMRKILILLASITLMAGCRELPDYFSGDRTLARVGEKKLRMSELTPTLPQGVRGDDSVALCKVYIDRWVRKQVKLQAAEQIFSASVKDIDRKVEEYRQTLLTHRLDEQLIDQQIDTVYTETEITAYYNAHRTDFRVDRPLVKGRIVRFKEGYRQAQKLRQLMGGKSEEQQQDFADICLKNEFTVTDFRDKWVDFSEFLSYLPALRSENNESVLNGTGIQQMRDSKSHYYYEVTEVKRPGDFLPPEWVTPTIRRILFKQRQEAIIHRYEEEIYARALSEERIEIFDEEDADQDSLHTAEKPQTKLVK